MAVVSTWMEVRQIDTPVCQQTIKHLQTQCHRASHTTEHLQTLLSHFTKILPLAVSSPNNMSISSGVSAGTVLPSICRHVVTEYEYLQTMLQSICRHSVTEYLQIQCYRLYADIVLPSICIDNITKYLQRQCYRVPADTTLQNICTHSIGEEMTKWMWRYKLNVIKWSLTAIMFLQTLWNIISSAL